MEKSQEQPKETKSEAPKPSLAEELLNKTLEEKEKEALAYNLPPEAFLNPQHIDSLPESISENRIEGLNASAQYQEMMEGVVVDKVLRPEMTDQEIQELTAELVKEYEAPIAEEAEQKEEQFMEEATAENQKEVVADRENTVSVISRMMGFLGEYFAEHKNVRQAMAVTALALELARHAPDAEAHSLGEQIVGTAVLVGEAAIRNEVYGAQQAGMNAERSADRAEIEYQRAVYRENVRYQRSLAQMDRQVNDPRRQAQNYQQTHGLSLQAHQEEQQQKLNQLHQRFKAALNRGDMVASAEIRRQIENEENRFVLEQRESIARNTDITEGGQYDQRMADIEAEHQSELQRIADWREQQRRNIGVQHKRHGQYVRTQTGNILMEGGFSVTNQAIFGSMHHR